MRSNLAVVLICVSSAPLLAQNRFADPTPYSAMANDPFLNRTTQSVLIADFDGDGRRDLAFGNQSHAAQILLGDGGWRFVSVPSALGTGFGKKLEDAGDIDGDGDVDVLAIVGGLAYTLANGGTGVFAGQIALPGFHNGAICAVFIDYDGDGDRDVVVAHDQGPLRAYGNNGAGSFVEQTATVMPPYNMATRAIACADVDGDGDRDLIVGTFGQPELFRNDAGAFTRVTATYMPQTGVAAHRLAVGDIDGDNDLDVAIGVDVTTPSAVNRLYVNDGTGHFTDESSQRLPAWTGPKVAFVDVDVDGDLDQILGSVRAQCEVFRNDGTGHFTLATSSFLGELMPTITGFAVGDLDNDARQDVVITAEPLFWAPEPYGRNVLLQNQPAGFVERFSPNDEPWGGMLPVRTMRTNSVTLLDHDRDGDLDLLYGNDFAMQDRLYDNDGNGVFTEVTRTDLPVDAANTIEVAVGDVNGDTFADLVLACYGGQNLLYLGTATGGFVQATWGRMPIGIYPSVSVALGDLDGDQDLDIVYGNEGQSRIYRNLGNGVFQDFTQFWMPVLSEPTRSIKLADLDSDGDLDLLAVVSGFGVSLRVYRNNGSGTMATTTALPSPTAAYNAVPGDFDGDGDMDVFSSNQDLVNTAVGTGRLLRNQGGGNFVASGSFQTAGAEGHMVAADLDGDGDLDVAATSLHYCNQSCYFGGTRVYINSGTGTFTQEQLPPVEDHGRGLAVGDVDGDGDPDLIVGNRFYVQLGGSWTLGQSRLHANLTRQVLVTGAPQLGTTQTVRTTSTPAAAAGPLLLASFVGFSLAPTPLPTPYGTLRLDPTNIIMLGASTGTTMSNLLAIPNVPSLNGTRLYFQSLVEGRDALGNAELRLTNAMGETLRP